MSTLFALCTFLIAVDAGEPVDASSEAALVAVPASPIAPTVPAAINGVTTSEPVVALTFDACATLDQANGFDREVFEILVKDQIPATLFLSGRWVEAHPGAAKDIATAPWIELGNHTYSHPRLSLLRPELIRFQIQHTNAILEKTIGRPALTLRPPAGAWDAVVAKIADQEHMPLILWTVVSGDVGGHVPPERIVRTVLEEAKPGGIIIFHINMRAPFTKKVLPDIIAGLREKGFRFVTVSQLLALPDAVPIKAKPSRFGFGMRRPAPEQKVDHADPPR